MFSLCRKYFSLSNRSKFFSGQTHRQEEEDERQVLQLESVLERVLRLPHRRDGHEEGRPRRDGQCEQDKIVKCL